MKKLLSLFFMIPCILFSHLAHAQSVPVIQQFSSIQLNEDGTITVTPYHYNMWCVGNNCGDKIILHKDEKYILTDGHLGTGCIIYKGIKGDKLLFEKISGSIDTKEKMVSPYTKEQFSEGREKEIWEHIKFNEENKSEIARLIKKLGIVNEQLLWTKYRDIAFVKFLVENGTDINYENKNGETILFPILLQNSFYAEVREKLCKKEVSILKNLTNLGIDIHHKDNKNKEVLDYISEKIASCDKEDEKHEERSDCSCLYVFEQILKGNPNPLEADEKTCNKLTHFEFITENSHGKNYCTPRCSWGEFREYNTGSCISCNNQYKHETAPEECSKCPNRSVQKHAENSYSTDSVGRKIVKTGNELQNLKPDYVECIRDYVFCSSGTIKAKDSGGFEICASCSSTSGIWTTKKECDRCPNRVMFEDECILKECPEEQFRAYKIACVPCDSLKDYESTYDDCLKCPNRTYKGRCIPKICPENTFRSLQLGSCISCSESESGNPVLGWDTTLEECNKCSERELIGKRCLLKVCPEGRFKINDGTCSSCDWESDFESTEEECSKCLQRVYKNGKCSLDKFFPQAKKNVIWKVDVLN